MGRSGAEETTPADGNGKQEKKTPGSSLVDSLSLTSRRDPIHISSQQLEFLYDEKRIVYRGDVVAVQGDVTMKSDQLTVLYEDVPPTAGVTTVKAGKPENSEGAAPGASKQRLKEIIAEGHVDITSGNRRATGKKAVFNESSRTVVLSGDAHVQELGNWVSGERVTVFLDEKRSIVEGGGERRAEMEIRSDQQEETKKGAKKP
jgi:lipopolysaccharide export system protein LptA